MERDYIQLPLLPRELWQSILGNLEVIDKIKLGIAVIGFENIVGCPVSITKIINEL